MTLNKIKQGSVRGKPLINFKETGNGPPVIFLHGIGGNSDNWYEQQNAIANDFTAIAWDARGYGDSDDYYDAYGGHEDCDGDDAHGYNDDDGDDGDDGDNNAKDDDDDDGDDDDDDSE